MMPNSYWLVPLYHRSQELPGLAFFAVFSRLPCGSPLVFLGFFGYVPEREYIFPAWRTSVHSKAPPIDDSLQMNGSVA